MSKSSTISRRPATMSDVSRRGAAAGSALRGGRPRRRGRVLGHLRLDARQQVRRLERRQGLLRDLLEGEAVDRLRLAVLGDLEVGGRQTAHDRAGPSRTMTSTETTLGCERNTGRFCAPGPDAVTSTAAAAMEAAMADRVMGERIAGPGLHVRM